MHDFYFPGSRPLNSLETSPEVPTFIDGAEAHISREAYILEGSPRAWPLFSTTEGYQIPYRMGIFTASLVIIASCGPTFVYLALRVNQTDPESVIQTSLAILASTLFIISSPIHRIIFNNWRISDALFGVMTLNDDTILNIKSEKMRRELGIALIVQGEMKLFSKDAGYSAHYSSKLNPGPMMLSILTFHPLHRMLVDQDGKIVLKYADGNTVQIQAQLESEGRYLMAKRYTQVRWWYMLELSPLAGSFLVI